MVMSKHTWDSLAESGHSPKMIEAMLAEQEQKKMSPLRKAMSELDYGLPEYVFDSEEGCEVHDLIQKVWEEIDNIEGRPPNE